MQRNLDEHSKSPKETLERLAKEAIKKVNGFIDWKNSPARDIPLEDVEPQKGWLCGKDALDAKCVCDCCWVRRKDFVDNVPLKQFEEKHCEAIKSAAKRRVRSAEEAEMLKRDGFLCPRQTHNSVGEPVWDMDEAAKTLLAGDIKHHDSLNQKTDPLALWNSGQAHWKCKPAKFRQRIHQHRRKEKFINHLEKQRNLKRDEFKKKMEPKEVTFERLATTKPIAQKTKRKTQSGNRKATTGKREVRTRGKSESTTGKRKRATQPSSHKKSKH